MTNCLWGKTSKSRWFLHHLGDALDAETPVDDHVFGYELSRELPKMIFEQALEGLDPLGADPPSL